MSESESEIMIADVKRTAHDITLTLTTENLKVGDKIHSEEIKFENFILRFEVIRFENKYDFNCLLKEKTKCVKGCVHHLIISTGSIFVLMCPSSSYKRLFHEYATKPITISDIKASLCMVPPQFERTFKTMYDDEVFLDFKIIVKGSCEGSGEEGVGFHRVVLAMWSPVMLNMFNNSWKEKNEGVLKLPVKLEVIRAFKKYVYTDELPEDRDTLLGLVELGSYFLDPKLETGASDAIVKYIDEEDILETFIYALEKRLHILSELMLMELQYAHSDVLKESLVKMLIG